VSDPRRDLQVIAADAALVLTACYALLLGAVVVGGPLGNADIPAWFYLLLPAPALAFVPSAVAAIGVHRTDDPVRVAALWRRSLVLAGLGWAGTIALIAVRAAS